ncbi:MAG: hypothetical protein EON93_16085, partial [Burkholderiales bacterium]
TDWELLRICPVPVLLIKSHGTYDAPRVLAAIDPAHSLDKPARLDLSILASARSISHALDGTLEVVHAYPPAPAKMPVDRMARADAIERLQARQRQQAARHVGRVLKAAGTSRATQHLVGMHPVDAIPLIARKMAADIVVMGAISRSGLRRVLFGDTAERLLDDLRCDLLIVKPPRFARRISEHTNGPNLRSLLQPSQVV